MPAGYIALLTLHGVLLLLSWRIARKRFSPAVAYFGTWTVSLFGLAIAPLLDQHQEQPSYATVTYLSAAAIAVFMGTCTAHAIGPVRRRWCQVRSGEFCKDRYRFRLLYLIAATGFLLVAFKFYSQYPNPLELLSNAKTIRAQLSDPNRETKSDVLLTLATTVTVLAIPAASLYWIRRRRFRWWVAAIVGTAALLTLITVGKFFAIFCTIIFLNVLLYARIPGATIRIPFRPILVVGAFLLSVFIVVTNLRTRSDTDLHESEGGLLQTAYVYCTGYIPAFNSFFDEYLVDGLTTFPINPDYDPHSRRVANQTLSGVYRAAASLGIVQRSATNRYDGAFNVYTIYRDLILDLRVVGSLLAAFAFACCSALVFRLTKPDSGRAVVLLSLLTAQMQFSLIYSLGGFVFYPIALMLAPLMVRPRTPSDHSESPANSCQNFVIPSRNRGSAYTIVRPH